jgi:flagellar L-ring protein precursor FlgH
MKKTLMLFLGLWALSQTTLWADSLFPTEGSSSIYNEKRARRVGDVITIMIEENTNATQAAGSQYQKNASVAV